MAEENSKLLRRSVVQKALASVKAFEKDARLACAPERAIKTRNICLPASRDVSEFCFLPDGQSIVVVIYGKIYLWHIALDECIRAFDQQVSTNKIDISPDGKLLVSGGTDHALRLWDISSGEGLKTVEGHTEPIKKVAFSPDGATVVSCTESRIGLLTLGSAGSFRRVGISAHDVVFSPDGKRIITASGDALHWLDPFTGARIQTFEMAEDVHHHLVVTPDGKTIVTSSDVDSCIRLIDTQTREQKKFEMDTIDPGESSLAISPDGETILYRRCGLVFLWDIREEQLLEKVWGVFERTIGFSPDNQHFALRDLVGGLDIWRKNVWGGHSRLQKKIIKPNSAAVRVDRMSLTPDGKTLLTSGMDGGVTLWDLRSGELESFSVAPGQVINTLDISSDGRTVLASFSDHTVRLWDAREQRCLHSWWEEDILSRVAISPDGKVVVYCDSKKIFIRDSKTGTLLFTFEVSTGQADWFVLAFSADSRTLYTKKTGLFHQWDLRRGKALREIRLAEFGKEQGISPGGFGCFNLNPDKTLCLSSAVCDRKSFFRLWDLEKGRCLQECGNFHSPVRNLVMHPDGKTALAGDFGNDLRVFDLETGESLYTLGGPCRLEDADIDWDPDGKGCGIRQPGGRKIIDELRISRDGKLIIGGNNEGTVYFWQYATGKLLATAYNLDRGYLWITPPDEVAPNGWLHTNRMDLIFLYEEDKADSSRPEIIPAEDERFQAYMRLNNDGEMVMARVNNWGRYQELLRLRLGNKNAMADRLKLNGREMRLRLIAGTEKDTE